MSDDISPAQAEKNFIEQQIVEVEQWEERGRTGGRPQIPLPMYYGFQAFWRGDRPDSHDVAKAGAEGPRYLMMWRAGYRAAFRLACRYSLVPIMAEDAVAGITYDHTPVTSVTEEGGQVVLRLYSRNGKPTKVLRPAFSVLWTQALPEGVPTLGRRLSVDDQSQEPFDSNSISQPTFWCGLREALEARIKTRHGDAVTTKSKTTRKHMLDPIDKAHQTEAAAAAERDKAGSGTPRRSDPTDRWTPPIDRPGLCHLLQLYRANHKLTVQEMADRIRPGLSGAAVSGWEGGGLPKEVPVESLAAALELSRETVNRAILWQWLNEYRDLAEHPVREYDQHRETGAFLFGYMYARGLGIEDVAKLAKMPKAQLAAYMALRHRPKGSVRARLQSALAVDLPVDKGSRISHGMPMLKQRAGRRQAFAVMPSFGKPVEEGAGVGTTVQQPVAPAPQVAVDMAAPGSDKTAITVVHMTLEDRNPWGTMADLVDERIISEVHYLADGTLSVELLHGPKWTFTRSVDKDARALAAEAVERVFLFHETRRNEADRALRLRDPHPGPQKPGTVLPAAGAVGSLSAS